MRFLRPAIIVVVLVFASIGALMFTHLTATERRITIATTTSLYDTRLLDVLRKDFEEKHGLNLYFIPRGTGIALQHARRGDADAVLTHAPSTEYQFMRGGYGVVRKIVAYNFFTIVGPAEDPAQVKDLRVLEVFQKIAEAGGRGEATWISRGDGSGTHLKEKDLWVAAGFDLSKLKGEAWYVESYAGMGAALRMANEKRAYTLADMGTYLTFEREVNLRVMVERGEELLNVYSVMAVNPGAVGWVNFDGATAFIKFLVSEEGQGIIANYGLNEYGRPLFYPAVKLLRENTDPELVEWITRYAFFEGNECPPEYRVGQEDLYG